MVRYIRVGCSLIALLGLAACWNHQQVSHEHLQYDLDNAVHQENIVPVAIVGSGPSGLSAALYVSRAGMNSFVFAGSTPGGQLTQTTYIENWPGREKVLGIDLMEDIKKQSMSFGATIIADTVTKIDTSSWPFAVQTEEGRSFKALSIILATGATPKVLNIQGEREFWGKGVTTCAVCDAPFFKGKEVVISGGGDSAAEMVFELAPYVKKVTMLVRKDHMRAAVAMQERVATHPNATVEYHKEIKKVYGEGDQVTAIDVYDNKLKMTERRPVDGVFLAIGHEPNNAMIKGAVPLDKAGYVQMKERSQESLVPGIFAAGEIQDPTYRQAIVAAGEGVKAALDATSFLYELGYNVEVGKKLEQHFFETFSDEKTELDEIYEDEELEKRVLNSKGVVLLDFYSTSCPACLKMLPYLESIAHKFSDELTILKVNYDKTKKTIFRTLWKEHDIKVRKLPSMIVFKDGKFVEMTNEVMSRKKLSQYIQKFF